MNSRQLAAIAENIREKVAEAGVKGGRCLLYTSDAADERSSVDLGGRRIIKKKKREEYSGRCCSNKTHKSKTHIKKKKKRTRQ